MKKSSRKKTKNKLSLPRVIHDLNNVLSSISLSAELLLREIYGRVNKNQKKYIKLIVSETKKIKKIVKKLGV